MTKKTHDCNDYRRIFSKDYDECKKCGRILERAKQATLINDENEKNRT